MARLLQPDHHDGRATAAGVGVRRRCARLEHLRHHLVGHGREVLVVLRHCDGCPVIPVTVQGTREILPADTWLARPGTITVTVGPPITPASGQWREMARLRDQALGGRGAAGYRRRVKLPSEGSYSSSPKLTPGLPQKFLEPTFSARIGHR